MSPALCTNKGDNYAQPSGTTAQLTDLLQQKRTWTKNHAVSLLLNAAARDE